jgi:hypothetical protein
VRWFQLLGRVDRAVFDGLDAHGNLQVHSMFVDRPSTTARQDFVPDGTPATNE